MCVQRNIEARSCNRCFSGKAMRITHPVCAFVALSIQHAMRMCHIVICVLQRSQYIPKLFHKQHYFRKKSY